MVLLEFYKDKHILITGTTGFLGKVILYRFLEAIPNFGKIYVLIRHKKGSSVIERFKKEIIESPCFDKLRKARPDFDAFIDSMIHPIAGDLVNKLGTKKLISFIKSLRKICPFLLRMKRCS